MLQFMLKIHNNQTFPNFAAALQSKQIHIKSKLYQEKRMSSTAKNLAEYRFNYNIYNTLLNSELYHTRFFASNFTCGAPCFAAECPDFAAVLDTYNISLNHLILFKHLKPMCENCCNVNHMDMAKQSKT